MVVDFRHQKRKAVSAFYGREELETDMTHFNASRPDDPFDLNRFLQAQENDYAQALLEIRSGQKRTHWIWFIFPQLDGLAFSSTSKHFAIKSRQEATAYLDHPVLGARLLECATALCQVEGKTAQQILGSTDALKVKSCATLFAQVSPAGSLFERLLARYYESESDAKTLQLLSRKSESASQL